MKQFCHLYRPQFFQFNVPKDCGIWYYRLHISTTWHVRLANFGLLVNQFDTS